MDEPSRARAARHRRTTISGALFGVGFAAFVDETVFHQLLHWHHFYDGSTSDAGLVSDGLFHAFGWFDRDDSLRFDGARLATVQSQRDWCDR